MRIIECSDALLHTQLDHLIPGQLLVEDIPQVSLNLSLSLPMAIAVIRDGTGRKLAQIIQSVR